MLDEGFLHSALSSNINKSTSLTNKAQDFNIISLRLTQSSKSLKKEHLLHEAVIKNDIAKVNSLLDSNIDVNSRIHLEKTPLHWAAMHGHLEMINVLVSNGADLEAEDKLGMTPLLVAGWYGHVQAIEKLIAWGSSPQAIDKKGQSILHCASKNDHFDVIKFLLNTCLNQLNLDAQDKKLQTALHFAVINDDIDIVNRLIDCGASLVIKDKNERTALHWAVVKGHNEILERLLQNKDEFDLNDREIEGKSALHLAAEFGHKKCAYLLLKMEADQYSTDNEGRTALHIAASLGYTSVCEVLLSASTNSPLKIREKKGNTALHLAVMGNHHKTVQVLIQHGASVNSMNSRQQTPLHIAAEMGFSESAQALLIQGADFTISEKASGRTALYIAARGSFPAIVDMLIKADRSRQSRSYSLYSELSQKCSLERNISLDSTDTHKTYLTSDSGDVTPNNLQHQLSRQQSEFSQLDLEAYNPVETIPSKINHQNSINLNKKQIHNNNTKEMRDLLCLIAKHYLDVSDWKKLAKLWHFSEEHIQAIEHQYTGKTSFKEHGHRMMSIWLHGLPPQQNALKELLNSLKLIERKDIADRIRKKMADGDFTSSNTIKDGISKTILGTKISSLMSEEISEGLRFGQGVVQIVASVVGIHRRKRCECLPANDGSCGYCCLL